MNQKANHRKNQQEQGEERLPQLAEYLGVVRDLYSQCFELQKAGNHKNMLTVARELAEEICKQVCISEEITSQKNPETNKIFHIQIGRLEKRDVVQADIATHLRVIQAYGNNGAHTRSLEERKRINDENFIAMCLYAVNEVVSWYFNVYRKQSADFIIPLKRPDTERDTKSAKNIILALVIAVYCTFWVLLTFVYKVSSVFSVGIGVVGVIVIAACVAQIYFKLKNSDDISSKSRILLFYFAGTTLLGKATLFIGFTLTLEYNPEVEHDFSGVLQIIFGTPWYINLALAFIAVLMLFYADRLMLPKIGTSKEKQRNNDDTEKLKEEEKAKAPVSPKSKPPVPEVFYKRVQALFNNKAFSRYRLKGYIEEAGYWVGTREDELSKRKLIIKCDYSGKPISEKDILNFLSHLRENKITITDETLKYYVVLDEKCIPHHGIKEHYPAILFKSEDQLLEELVDFKPYLSLLVEKFSKDPLPFSLSKKERTLKETFVPPRFQMESNVKGGSDKKEVLLAKHLDGWQNDGSLNQIALLGDYGMGKSSFFKFYAARLAERRLQGDKNLRIPVLVQLTGRTPRSDPACQGLISEFITKHDLKCSLDTLDLLMKRGKLLFLIDAFDEVDMVGDRDIRMSHFIEIWKLATGNNKFAISGRPSYFLTNAELDEALRIAKPTEFSTGQPKCMRVNLKPFGTKEIRKSFELYFPADEAQKHFNVVEQQSTLRDLAGRPAMMHIIRETITEFSEISKGQIKSAHLLKQYTEHWIIREEVKKRTLLIEAKSRQKFMEELASFLYLENKTQITGTELIEKYLQWFPEEQDRASKTVIREGMNTDLRTCSFLVPTDNNGYKYAHKSFFEYFVASFIIRQIREKGQVLTDYLNRSWPHEISSHVGEIALLYDDLADKILFYAISSKMSWIRKLVLPLLLFRKSLHDSEEEAKSQINLFDQPRLNGLQVLLSKGVDYKWIQSQLFSNRWKRVPNIVSFSNDCLAFLNLTKTELCNTNLSSAKLKGTNFFGINLAGADLGESNLEGANLGEANLKGANLKATNLGGANLESANLVGANFGRAYLRKGKLEKANLEAADLIKADLAGANLEEANLVGANLEGANLEGANLAEANLEGANLAEANLEGANLAGANLEGANLEGANLLRSAGQPDQ